MKDKRYLDREIQNIIFIDIETLSCVENYSMLSIPMQSLWANKAHQIAKIEEVDLEKIFRDRAAIYSEFGRVVVISLGYVKLDQNDKYSLKIKTLYAKDEKELLLEFKEVLSRVNQNELIFCGHNIKEFDLPYISRRMVVNYIDLPPCLDLSGKKPWEVKHLDTMEMWGFGDKKNFTSLHLLSNIFGIESSKENMHGGQVHDKIYKEGDLESVADYCSKDVVVVAKLYFRIRGLGSMLSNNILFS